MFVRAVQLDAGKTGEPQILQQRGQIPVGAPIVSDQSKLHGKGPRVQ